MFYNLLSTRAIQVGIAFFVLVFGGSLLYSWYVQQTTQTELARPGVVLQDVNRDESRTATIDTSPVDFAQTPSRVEVDGSQMAGDTDAFPIDEAIEFTDVADAFLPDDFVLEDAAAEDVAVSPYGFGPFPEVPSDYPDQGVWSEEALRSMRSGHELISRVRIALWNQGVRTIGGVYDNGHRLIYPIIDDVVYIRWSETPGINGKPYVQRQLTTPAVADQYYDDIQSGIFPPHLTIYEFPDGGIDPYEFLGL